MKTHSRMFCINRGGLIVVRVELRIQPVGDIGDAFEVNAYTDRGQVELTASEVASFITDCE